MCPYLQPKGKLWSGWWWSTFGWHDCWSWQAGGRQGVTESSGMWDDFEGSAMVSEKTAQIMGSSTLLGRVPMKQKCQWRNLDWGGSCRRKEHRDSLWWEVFSLEINFWCFIRTGKFVLKVFGSVCWEKKLALWPGWTWHSYHKTAFLFVLARELVKLNRALMFILLLPALSRCFGRNTDINLKSEIFLALLKWILLRNISLTISSLARPWPLEHCLEINIAWTLLGNKYSQTWLSSAETLHCWFLKLLFFHNITQSGWQVM